jgi:hypothetical protein
LHVVDASRGSWMGKDIGNECVERFRLAFRFDFYCVGANIAYESADVVTGRGSPNRFSKENALNYTTNL